jgi:hypothetical protein
LADNWYTEAFEKRMRGATSLVVRAGRQSALLKKKKPPGIHCRKALEEEVISRKGRAFLTYLYI